MTTDTGSFASRHKCALVVQADAYNATVGHVLDAEITTNLTPANDPAFVLIYVATPDGKASGLDQTSLASWAAAWTASRSCGSAVWPGSAPAWRRHRDAERRQQRFGGYKPQFFFKTTNVTGEIRLPGGVEMVMPGDNAAVAVRLDKPVALDAGSHFAIREGGRTVGSGVVTDVVG